MANIVLGLATTHSPNVSTPVELWHLRGENDPNIVGRETFDRLLQQNSTWASEEITSDKWQERYDQIQRAIAELAQTFAEVQPEVVVTVGDDQRELFADSHRPAIDIYLGESARDVPPEPNSLNELRRSMIWAEHANETIINPCDAALSRHLVESLVAQEFDLSYTRELPEGRNLGHAFNFIYRRIMGEHLVPQIPVMLNTYYPPNQPTLKRCYALGRALRRAIDSWQSDKRVAVVASGGLSHFVVDEELDRGILKALQEKDVDALLSYPEELFMSGTSEIRNWVVVAGAMEASEFELDVVDYVPLYRSLAGTGVGAGFVRWALV